MPHTRQINDAYNRQIEGNLRVVSEEARQVKLSFSSEQPYDRWFGREILSHDPDAVDLSRLQEVGSLLFHHGRDPNLGSIPVGRIVDCTLDSERGRCEAIVEFDADEKSDLIFQKVRSGSIRGVSVGYAIRAHEELKEGVTRGRFTGPCIVATRWTPFEISIEPTPADDSVGIGRSIQSQNSEREELTMNEETTNATQEQQPTEERSVAYAPVLSIDADASRAEARSEERVRAAEITALCRDAGMDPTEYIAGNRTIDEVKDAVIKHLRSAGQSPTPAPRLEVVADEEDKYRAAARDGLLLRMGFHVASPTDGAGDFRGMNLRTLAAQCLQRSGGNTVSPFMDDEALLRAALGVGERSALAPASSFVSIMNDTMGAVLSDGYNTANTTFDLWCAKGSNPNFKPAKRYRLSASGDMEEIKESGEFKADAMYDEGVDTQLKTHGKKFGFTRKAFLDDDLGTITKSIQAQARSAKRGINREVYRVLTANRIGNEDIFSQKHANLGTPGALSTTTLGELYVLTSAQKGIGKNPDALNIRPAFALFPVALTMEAWKLLNSIADPEAAHAGVINPMQGKVQPIIEAELDKYSSTAFYTAASPRDVDTIEVTYLNGREEPTMESRVSWETLGIEYRMYLDYGITVLDYRGLAKNAGK